MRARALNDSRGKQRCVWPSGGAWHCERPHHRRRYSWLLNKDSKAERLEKRRPGGSRTTSSYVAERTQLAVPVIRWKKWWIHDEYGKTHSRSRFLERQHTTDFELVQLVGITSTMYTCMVFLNPYIKCFMFVYFVVNLWGVGRTVGPNRELFMSSVFQKWQTSSSPNFWPVWALCVK